MFILIKIILIFALIGITYQDIKERQVFLWLLVLAGTLMGYLHFQESISLVFLGNILFNFSIVLIIYSSLVFYSFWKLKKSISQTFGLGDLLFFVLLAIGFTTVTFLVLFSFSLIFSLVFYLSVKSKLKIKTVPLAGLQALFIGLIYTTNWMFKLTNLYAL
ncbi:MAG: general secretion pathway protein [Flavobacteriaceae bacterium]|nr:general secretion pathway protein [Flavobacteriaceae bacterium]